MPNLAILEETRTFPPKKFFLVVWIVVMAFAVAGLMVTPSSKLTIYIWLIIAAISFWQVWTIRWVQVDNELIRVRNIFQRGRQLRWAEVTRYHEEEVRLNKGSYVLVLLSNEGSPEATRPTKINLTSDQVEFETLREIIRQCTVALR